MEESLSNAQQKAKRNPALRLHMKAGNKGSILRNRSRATDGMAPPCRRPSHHRTFPPSPSCREPRSIAWPMPCLL